MFIIIYIKVESVSMFMVVYDVTSDTSFKAAEGWIKKIRDQGVKSKRKCVILFIFIAPLFIFPSDFFI